MAKSVKQANVQTKKLVLASNALLIAIANLIIATTLFVGAINKKDKLALQTTTVSAKTNVKTNFVVVSKTLTNIFRKLRTITTLLTINLIKKIYNHLKIETYQQ